MTIKDLKKELKIKDADIAQFFGIVDKQGNPDANKYRNSKGGKTKIDTGMVNLWLFIKDRYSIK